MYQPLLFAWELSLLLKSLQKSNLQLEHAILIGRFFGDRLPDIPKLYDPSMGKPENMDHGCTPVTGLVLHVRMDSHEFAFCNRVFYFQRFVRILTRILLHGFHQTRGGTLEERIMMPEFRTDKLGICLTRLSTGSHFKKADSNIFVCLCHSILLSQKAFSKFIEGFAPALLSAHALSRCGKTAMLQSYLCLAILVFKYHRHQHLQRKILTHAVMRRGDNVPVLIGKRVGIYDPLRGNDFAIDARAPVVPSRRGTHTVEVPAPHAQIHFAERTCEVFRSPPAFEVLRFRPGLPDQSTRRVEHARNDKLTASGPLSGFGFTDHFLSLAFNSFKYSSKRSKRPSHVFCCCSIQVETSFNLSN